MPANKSTTAALREKEQSYQQRLRGMLARRADLMQALHLAASLQLSSWAIAAGAIRAMVWDEMHGLLCPTPIPDWDLVYYDAALPLQSDRILRRDLEVMNPLYHWDVVNQAHIHRWLSLENQQPVAAYSSLSEAIGAWPETATCIGVYLNHAQEIEIIAPHGLSDLFELTVRPNPACPSPSAFAERRTSKNWQLIWSELKWLE